MTRKQLLNLICPSNRMQDCENYHCVDCNLLLIKWLDEYDKQIRAEVIDEFVHEVKEHHYVLSDVINSTDYGMFTVCIEQIAEQLKEQNK